MNETVNTNELIPLSKAVELGYATSVDTLKSGVYRKRLKAIKPGREYLVIPAWLEEAGYKQRPSPTPQDTATVDPETANAR